MAKKNKGKIILIDADVVSHFIKAREIYSLNSIFDYEIRLLDKVYDELNNNLTWKTEIDNLIAQKVLIVEPFPETNNEIKKEYFHIKKLMFKGDGESACLAYVRYTKNIIASSNLKDIKNYCNLHDIEYLTTMDFLCHALNTGIFTIERCNTFIEKVLQKKGKLPVRKMEDYTCREITI
ncbi:hypothetical protein [Formosa sp. S-31]|uniref:hypothetical protein n=1 Tax=Formosa sp. S-31 TaxID=2790949 RepID=UPI003EB9356B